MEARQDIQCFDGFATTSEESQLCDSNHRTFKMAETNDNNDDDVKSNKRSHADFTGDDGAGMFP